MTRLPSAWWWGMLGTTSAALVVSAAQAMSGSPVWLALALGHATNWWAIVLLRPARRVQP